MRGFFVEVRIKFITLILPEDYVELVKTLWGGYVVRSNFWTQPEASIVEVVKGKDHEHKTPTVQRGVQAGNRAGRDPRGKARGATLPGAGDPDNLYYKWHETFQERAPSLFASQEQQDQAVSELETRVAELERMVGKLTMQLEIAKKASTWRDGAPARNGRWS